MKYNNLLAWNKLLGLKGTFYTIYNKMILRVKFNKFDSTF